MHFATHMDFVFGHYSKSLDVNANKYAIVCTIWDHIPKSIFLKMIVQLWTCVHGPYRVIFNVIVKNS
jgi:hypothetical protein